MARSEVIETPQGVKLESPSVRRFRSRDEYLYIMKEDLSEWFNLMYNLDITADCMMARLENGVLLCIHANNVTETALQTGSQLAAESNGESRITRLSFWKEAKQRSFQARDNVASFLNWTRQLGVNQVLLFETEDLVLRKNEKNVILCLLEVARRGGRIGMQVPCLVQLEREIEKETALQHKTERGSTATGLDGDEIKSSIPIGIDEAVSTLIRRCTCPSQFTLVKMGNGKYRLGATSTIIFIRILRNHVMVRVGGGWDTLENYLNKHDPCRCRLFGHRKEMVLQSPSSDETSLLSSPTTSSGYSVDSGLLSSGSGENCDDERFPAVNVTPSGASKNEARATTTTNGKFVKSKIPRPSVCRAPGTGEELLIVSRNSVGVHQLARQQGSSAKKHQQTHKPSIPTSLTPTLPRRRKLDYQTLRSRRSESVPRK